MDNIKLVEKYDSLLILLDCEKTLLENNEPGDFYNMVSESVAETERKLETINNLLNSLPGEELQTIAKMFYLEHIPVLEIAYKIGYSERSIYNRLTKIRSIINENKA